jgi:hypothetical protein
VDSGDNMGGRERESESEVWMVVDRPHSVEDMYQAEEEACMLEVLAESDCASVAY